VCLIMVGRILQPEIKSLIDARNALKLRASIRLLISGCKIRPTIIKQTGLTGLTRLTRSRALAVIPSEVEESRGSYLKSLRRGILSELSAHTSQRPRLRSG